MKYSSYILKTGKILILVLLISLFFQCKNNKNPVPDVYVDFYINIEDPVYSSVKIPGNYLYLKGGVNGIILYHTVDDRYKAFERTCTYDPDCGIVSVKEDKFTAVDSVCCGSEFSLLVDGVVTQGPC
jgi:hypothetical protein